MYFSMLKLVDRSECSFEIPDFGSHEAERKWGFTLRIKQPMELLNLSNRARYGDEAMSRTMDRNPFQILGMDEFNAIKKFQHAEDQAWLEDKKRKYLAAGVNRRR